MNDENLRQLGYLRQGYSIGLQLCYADVFDGPTSLSLQWRFERMNKVTTLFLQEESSIS